LRRGAVLQNHPNVALSRNRDLNLPRRRADQPSELGARWRARNPIPVALLSRQAPRDPMRRIPLAVWPFLGLLSATALAAAMLLSARAATCEKASGEVAIVACHALAGIHYNSGIDYRQEGDNDRAIAEYDEAIRLDPDYTNAYTNRGNVWHDKGDYDRAIADYSAAIRLAPNDTAAFFNRGLTYAAKDDLERAIADLSETIRLAPNHARALYVRGVARHDRGDAAGGDADIAAAKAIDADVARAFAGDETN
jgi:tetratricopeptide (TPR) repeat protein